MPRTVLLVAVALTACRPSADTDTDALPGEISLSANSLDFGEQEVLSVVQQELVIENTGAGPLHVYDVSFDNDMMLAHWTLTRFTSGWLDAGDSKTVSFTLYPRDLGDLSTTVTIHSNDPVLPEVSVALLGESYGVPQIDAGDDTVTWDESVTIGETEEAELALRNLGNDDLTISGTEITEGEDVFTVTVSPDGATLAPGDDNGLVVIEFTPDATGPHLGNLRITSDDPSTPSLDVPLSATGVAP